MPYTRFCRFAVKKAVFILLLIINLHAMSAVSHAADFAVTSPWVGAIASFIGGDKVHVRYLSVWNDKGMVASVGRPRSSEIVIALDADDSARFRIGRKAKNLRLLYEKLPMTGEQLRSAFFDPAILPFIAQNIMKIMAEEDKKRYSFYQRRLAEFQSRVESTIDIGRHLLSKTNILDATGAQGTWIRSAVRGAVRPPASVWNSWVSGDTASIKAAFDEAKNRKWLILMDPWTPEQIRNVAAAYDNRMTLAPPVYGMEYFVYLHEIFLSIWNKTKVAAPK